MVQMRLLRDFSLLFDLDGPDRLVRQVFGEVVRITKPNTFIDVGANIGFFSWLFISLQPRYKSLFLFEPDPENVALLRGTIRRNNLESVQVFPCALGQTTSRGRFFVDEKSGATGSLEEWRNPPGSLTLQGFYGVNKGIPMNVEPLDRWIKDLPLPSEVLLKIDTERGDESVMLGGKEVLETRSPIVFCETLGKEAERIVQMMGYQIVDFGDQVSDKMLIPSRLQNSLTPSLLNRFPFLRI